MVLPPFKPPLLQRKSTQLLPCLPSANRDNQPEHKRQRISNDTGQQPTVADASVFKPTTHKPFIPPRKPLHTLENGISPTKDTGAACDRVEGFYTVLWRKFTLKKHKTWDGDGVLSVRDGYAHLQDIDGRSMGKITWNKPLLPGSSLSIGGKDIEVDSVITKEDFLAGRPFLGVEVSRKPTSTLAPTHDLPRVKHKPAKKNDTIVEPKSIKPAASKAASSGFKTPYLGRPLSSNDSKPKATPIPRHDPNMPEALVMKRPTNVPKGKQIVDVVVDPFLAKHLRDHQRQGVQFLYECVMGMSLTGGQGAILADEMGLGKTLQTIALLWTLLKQNPIYDNPPVVKKALIVCPAGLINNWRKEFRKWLGYDRIAIFVADDKRNRLTDFTKGMVYSIMIVGYEKLRTIQEELKAARIDIVIADEGHRLKTAQNKSALAIKSLDTDRRIILSGTPMQNELSEFFTMVDFVNPNFLGNYNTFKREFENPILKSRQPNATEKEIEKGEARNEELARLTSQFILRRTASIIAKYLPPKTETVLFCRPTSTQASLYRAVLQSPVFNAVLGSAEASLQLINILKKLCNSPSLFLKSASEDIKPNETIQSLLDSISPELLKIGPSASAKLRVLDSLLHRLRKFTDEKIVIVSNYTSTLDMVGNLLSSLGYPFLRLDGTTPASKRQVIVDKFNKSKPSLYFAFLLSAKAGGVGLNLIGASRLVLFDVDWNPATDQQAMARIHRDGQTKPCYVYRLLVQGALDEKIYQRQLTKTGLADAVVDAKKTAQGFTKEELRDLFRLEEEPFCQTHLLLRCSCEGEGNVQALSAVVEKERTFGTTSNNQSDDEEEDGEEDLPALGTLMNASHVDMESQESAIRQRTEQKSRKRKREENMLALMQFIHLDAEKIRGGDEEAESLIEDRVLLDLLKEEGSQTSFMFSRTTS